MRLTPPPPSIGAADGFTKENDLFGLSEFGDRLSNLVCGISEPLVIALDGPWGSGKSTFLRQWAGLLRKRGVPVILFDAFANDHQEDAFICLASEIAALAQLRIKNDGVTVDNFVDKAKKVGRVLMPLAVRASLRAATLSLLSIEDLNALSEGVQQAVKDTVADASALTEQLIEERLRRAQVDRDTLEAFRTSLSKLAGQLGSDLPTKPAGPPLVFIIDELDRCRPPFALNLLERVKHLFSVENVCFVLVSHVPQLAAVIRGSYGSEVDGRTYLEKFFHLRIELPEPHQTGQNRNDQYVRYLWRTMELSSDDPGFDDAVQKGLATLGAAYGLSLRSLERVAAYIALFCAATNKRYFREASLVVGLCVMKQREPDLFTKARAGILKWPNVEKFLRLDEWQDERAREFYSYWWRFVSTDNLPEEDWVRHINTSLFAYNVERKRILPILSNHIESLKVADA